MKEPTKQRIIWLVMSGLILFVLGMGTYACSQDRKTLMSWVSAISGIIAAVLWFSATVVKVKHKRETSFDITFENSGRQIGFLATAMKQTTWNMWAALFTGISMLAQAISLLITECTR